MGAVLAAHNLDFHLLQCSQLHGTDSPEVGDELCVMQKYSINVYSSLMLSDDVKSISSSAEAEFERLRYTYRKIHTNAHMKTLSRPGSTLNNKVWV